MLADALFVFLEVVVSLVLAIAALWLIAKALGYIASVFEGEPLLPTIRADIASTRREVRRLHSPERRTLGGTRLPSAG